MAIKPLIFVTKTLMETAPEIEGQVIELRIVDVPYK
jgi:hypothetical protein